MLQYSLVQKYVEIYKNRILISIFLFCASYIHNSDKNRGVFEKENAILFFKHPSVVNI